ncbi:NADP-dependent oxidoreductase [Streptomyces sp. MBT62]|uniref:NADP-dependent oxidoreductase n=1 Tax=Streptomyces sp. MBT62 TaxID=2800410 RepID=UPI001909A8A5|nr:NADP-dependent oxidoreductase [Streptomyces sp. MBT62]MBK3570589.1 NADP-dependent oxidoreductase [Streptomyces sp. MBT62]
MRAVAVRKTGGKPELMELPEPRPAPGEMLVELTAASVNPIDMAIAAGAFEGRMPHVYPLVLGVDGAGRVAEVGEGVSGLGPGDVVHGQFLRAPLGNGTFADYAVVTEFPDGGALQRVPDGMPAEIAAALPTAGMTALGALEAMGLREGQSILVVGATGGVGVFAVQLAAAKGAEVIATARPDADRWIRQLGAARTADYTVGGVAEQVRRTHPGGVDAVLDLTRDPARFGEYAGLVRDGGAAVSVSLTASPELLASERIAVSNFMMADKPDLLARITAEASSGRIRVPVHRTITLDRVPEALTGNAAGGARGKTTVRI